VALANRAYIVIVTVTQFVIDVLAFRRELKILTNALDQPVVEHVLYGLVEEVVNDDAACAHIFRELLAFGSEPDHVTVKIDQFCHLLRPST
jgi:hypothetical protein